MFLRDTTTNINTVTRETLFVAICFRIAWVFVVVNFVEGGISYVRILMEFPTMAGVHTTRWAFAMGVVMGGGGMLRRKCHYDQIIAR